MKLKDLKSPNKEKRDRAWKEVLDALDNFQVQNLVKDKSFFRSLLWFPLKGVREDAWNHLVVYKKLSIDGIEKILSANSDRIKIYAWEKIDDLISYGLVTKDVIISEKKHFWRLLKSYYPTIRKRAWKIFPKLVEEGIFSAEDSYRFMEFLRHRKPSVRIFAWKAVPMLLEKGFIKKEDVEKEIKYLEELLTKESKVKKTALKLLKLLRG